MKNIGFGVKQNYLKELLAEKIHFLIASLRNEELEFFFHFRKTSAWGNVMNKRNPSMMGSIESGK